MSLFKKLLNNNKGITLVELLVTLGIMSIVTAGIGAAVVSATRSYSNGSVEVDMQTDAQNITNIITNLVIDSTECTNADPADGTANTSNLYVRSVPTSWVEVSEIDGSQIEHTDYTYYALVYNATSKEIKYGKSIDSYADAADAGNLFTLATNVDAFTADASSFSKDYTVHVDLDMYSQASRRSIQTSFSVTSRNAQSAGAVVEADGAVIAVNTMMVMEPNQSIDRKYDILESGSISGSALNIQLYYQKSVSAEKITDGSLTVTDDGAGNLTIVTNGSIKPDPTQEDKAVYIRLATTTTITDEDGNTHPCDEKWITVYIREITNIYINGKRTNNKSAARKDSTYKITSTLGENNIYNPDRFYAFPEDQDYVEPYPVIWRITCTVDNILDYIEFTDGTAPDDLHMQGTKTIWGYYDGSTPNSIITIKFKEDLPAKESITFTCISAHSMGKYTDASGVEKLTNKTGDPYPSTGYVSASYTIKRSFFDDGYKRGKVAAVDTQYHTITAVRDIIEPVFKKWYGTDWNKNTDNKALYEKYFKSMQALIDGDDNATDNIRFTVVFSVGTFEYNEDGTKKVDEFGEEIVHWTPYRNLDMQENATNFRYNENVAFGMLPNQEYMLEHVAVLYNKNTKEIIYPHYAKLLKEGNGFDGYGWDSEFISLCYSSKVMGSGEYFFDESEYLMQSPVAKALVFFEENDNDPDPSKRYGQTISGKFYSIGEYQSVLGSLGSPVKISSTTTVALNPEYQGFMKMGAYTYDFGLVLQKYDPDKKEFVKVSEGTSVQTPKGGVQVQIDSTTIRFNKVSSADDDGSVYRLLLTMRGMYVAKLTGNGDAFTTDANVVYTGVSNLDSKYYLANGSTPSSCKYTFPLYYDLDTADEQGTLYFTMSKNYFTFDANCNNEIANPAKIPAGSDANTFPIVSRDGYIFEGWYTAKTGGTKIDNTNWWNYTQEMTLYAHWAKAGTATVAISDFTAANWNGSFGGLQANIKVTVSGGPVTSVKIPCTNIKRIDSDTWYYGCEVSGGYITITFSTPLKDGDVINFKLQNGEAANNNTGSGFGNTSIGGVNVSFR